MYIIVNHFEPIFYFKGGKGKKKKRQSSKPYQGQDWLLLTHPLPSSQGPARHGCPLFLLKSKQVGIDIESRNMNTKAKFTTDED